MKAYRQWSVLTILVLALVLAWLVFDSLGPQNPLRDGLSQVISPLQLVTQRAWEPISAVFGSLRRISDVRAENEALRAEVAQLRNQVILMYEAQIENENLRRQLGFKSAVPNYQLLSAEVIGRDPGNYLQYLTIDRGAEDGLRRGMPVLTEAGLVGRISLVSRNASQVMLITDPSSSVSAFIQRSRATGVAQGRLGSELMMRYIAQAETVVVGDLILTSGLGGNFPKRLVIGQVVSVRRGDVEMFQEAAIAPAVDLRQLESVMVLLNFDPPELP